MTTREEMAGACAWAAPTLDRGPAGPDDDREGIEMGRRLMHAHLQLKRDGELRERLAKQIEKLRNHHIETPCCGNSEWRGKLCLLHQGIAMVVDEIEALLKEFP